MDRKKTKIKISRITAWAGILFVLIWVISGIFRMGNKKTEDTPAYIGKPEITISDGKMTPEVLLAFGRMSDLQVSPDGSIMIYGVSYTSIAENRACTNLWISGTDGSAPQELTHDGSSISNARWTSDGKRIVFIQGGQIWSARLKESKGSYTLGKRTRISDVTEGISEFTLSPDQKKILYVSTVQSALQKPSDIYPDLDKSDAISADDLMYRHWDHWVREVPHTFIADFSAVKTGSVTRENSTDILAGEPEIYELPTEPFGDISQIKWSPDGKSIAYSCRKLTGKKYAFSTNTEIYIYDTASGECTRITNGGGYDTDPVWSPDGSKLCWVSMARDGYEADRQRLMCADITWEKNKGARKNGGAARTPSAQNITEITSAFKYNVSAPVWSSASDGIYFSALAEGIQGIFRAYIPADSATKSKKETRQAKGQANAWNIERITGEDLWFDFSTPFHITEKDGITTLLACYCSMDFPTEIAEIRLDRTGTMPAGQDGVEHSMPLKSASTMTAAGVSVRQISSVNTDILSRLDSHRTEARYVKTTDGKDMLTWVLYPPQFDSTRTYPSILICLGGPQGTLSQGWSYRWNYRLMADQGYVVVLPNRRGTTAFGQEWTEQISGDYCGQNMQDYLSAARELKAEPYVGKMAACGASYGGYSVYYLCGIHGNTFDAFVAHAGIFNEEHMYMTTEEMWFPNWDNGGLHEFEADPLTGTENGPVGPAGDGETFGGIRQGGSPWSNAPKAVRHYAQSPHNLVTRWHTPILVTHGEMDFRVPVDEGMAAYNAAQMMGVPSRLIVFPGENHWILRPQNALYWHREYFRWLDRWCK